MTDTDEFTSESFWIVPEGYTLKAIVELSELTTLNEAEEIERRMTAWLAGEKPVTVIPGGRVRLIAIPPTEPHTVGGP